MKKENRKKPMTLVPGKCYRGSGMVNEFGEVTFSPYQEGAGGRDNLRTVASVMYNVGSFSILKNQGTVSLRVTVPIGAFGGSRLKMHDTLRDLFIQALIKLAEYEI